jgi:response regulator NasT
VIGEGFAALEDCELFVVTERRGLVARMAQIDPDIVLMDLGNPSRDVLEEYFAVSRVLDRPIAMFVDESDEESIGASIDAGVSAYVVDGFAPHRIRRFSIWRSGVSAPIPGCRPIWPSAGAWPSATRSMAPSAS